MDVTKPPTRGVAPNFNTTAFYEALLRPDPLAKLCDYFEEIQTTKPGVNLQEFRKIMIDTLNFKQTDVDYIFQKADSQSTGVLVWVKFLRFLLNELRLASQSIASQIILKETSQIYVGQNTDMICSIMLVPQFDPETKTLDFQAGRYISVSKDATLACWAINWVLQRSLILPKCVTGVRKRWWVCTLVSITNLNYVAVSTTEDVVKFYDLANNKFELIIVVTKFPGTVTAMDYWFDLTNHNNSVLVVGDSCGNVIVFTFSDCKENGLFGTLPGKTLIQIVDYHELLQGNNCHVKIQQFKGLHDEQVNQVYYCSGLKSFISCSRSSKVSMALYNLTLGTNRRIFCLHYGFNCFDFSALLNVIVTGGVDRAVRVWNPYVTTKSLMTFFGHNASITCVFIINESDQIISASADRFIKVWDMKEQVCLQTVMPRTVGWGPYPITCALHNPYKRQLVFCNEHYVVIDRYWDRDGDDSMVFHAHRMPIRAAVYNSRFNQVISACEAGTIYAWDAETGRKLYEILGAHTIRIDGLTAPCDITSMSLDEAHRRLFTCGRDRKAKVWDVSNGANMKTVLLPDEDPMYITNIMCVKERVVLGGWGGRIIVYNENLDSETRKIWPRKYKEDILYMVFVEPNYITIASWDGAVRLWDLDSGHLQTTLHLYQCLLNRPAVSSNVSMSDKTSQVSHPSMGTSAAGSSRPSITKSKTFTKKRRKSKATKIPLVNLQLYNILKENPSPIPCLLSLRRRELKGSIGNLIVSDFNGLVQLWSTHPNGGLLALWSSITSNGQYVCAMTTDTKNHILLCGDTQGFVRAWYMKYYYSGIEEPPNVRSEICRFPFLRGRLKPVVARAEQLVEMYKPIEFEGIVDVRKPLLLFAYRAHLGAISSIEFVDGYQVIITSASDGAVRFWTIYGRFIGALGDPRGWVLSSIRPDPPIYKLPADVRKVASAVTLQVMNGGLGPRWKKMKEKFLNTYVRAMMRDKEGSTDLSIPSRKRKAKDEREIKEVAVDESKFLAMTCVLGKNFHFLPHPPKVVKLPPVAASIQEGHRTLTSSTCEMPGGDISNAIKIKITKEGRILSPDSDRQQSINLIKKYVNGAIRKRKIFTVLGNNETVRNVLRKRGWVEKTYNIHRLPVSTKAAFEEADDFDTEEQNDSPFNCDIVYVNNPVKEDEAKFYSIMSWMVKPYHPTFIWTRRRDHINFSHLKTDQIVNHFPLARFTTKIGLSRCMEELHWINDIDASCFFPRCYRTVMPEELEEFIDDYRLTTCICILKWVVHTVDKNVKENNTSSEASIAFPPEIIKTALDQCELFFNSKKNEDVDTEFPKLSKAEWDYVLDWHYQLIHGHSIIKKARRYYDSCASMLAQIRPYWHQMTIDGMHNLWIVKPAAKSRGEGIKILQNLEEIMYAVELNSPPYLVHKYVVQKYIETPLLIEGTKFDIRQWFLVTDWNPLTIYLYKDCYIRFCSRTFSLQDMHKAIHLCNNAIQKNYIKQEKSEFTFIPREYMWSLDQFKEYLKIDGKPAVWEDKIFPGIKKGIISAIRSAQDGFPSRKKCFELYGGDFMISEDYQTWLIEINSNPCLASTTSVTAKLCTRVIEDTLKVVLDLPKNSKSSIGRFQCIYRQQPIPSLQYVGVLLKVEGKKLKSRSKNVKLNDRTKTSPLQATTDPSILPKK